MRWIVLLLASGLCACDPMVTAGTAGVPTPPPAGITLSGAIQETFPYGSPTECWVGANWKLPGSPPELDVLLRAKDRSTVGVTVRPYRGPGDYGPSQAMVIITTWEGQMWFSSHAEVRIAQGLRSAIAGRVESGSMYAREGPSTAEVTGNWQCVPHPPSPAPQVSGRGVRGAG